LRAFHEAGVKLDIVAGVGIGVAGALMAAVDGGARLWEPNGVWRSSPPPRFYQWRRSLQVAAAAVGAALVVLLVPLLFFLLAVLVYPAAFVLETAGLSVAPAIADAFGRLLSGAFRPGALPTILPRLAVAALGVLLGVAIASVVRGRRESARRRERGAVWWKALGGPIETRAVSERFAGLLWPLVRGAATGKAEPSPAALSRAYTEVLAENVGQPGFRELIVTAHDLDTRRDLVFGLLNETERAEFFGRPDDRRQSEVFDLAGGGKEAAGDALLAALRLPIATDPHLASFPPESYWRGETHRLCSRPEALGRVLDEVAAAGAEQIVLVTAVPDVAGPHTLTAGPRDPRARLGEYLAATEGAAVQQALSSRQRRRGLFVIRPQHNPLGPLDFEGCHDDRSDRVQTLAELVDRGYEDAYRQFIEPVVAASGDRLHTLAKPRRTPTGTQE
jgi:hypothetical protein